MATSLNAPIYCLWITFATFHFEAMPDAFSHSNRCRFPNQFPLAEALSRKVELCLEENSRIGQPVAAYYRGDGRPHPGSPKNIKVTERTHFGRLRAIGWRPINPLNCNAQRSTDEAPLQPEGSVRTDPILPRANRFVRRSPLQSPISCATHPNSTFRPRRRRNRAK